MIDKSANTYFGDTSLLKFTYDLFESNGFSNSFVTQKIIGPYLEEHRFFHTKDHVIDILQKIYKDYIDGNINEHSVTVLVLAAWYHDIVYNPKSKTNEEDSASVFFRHFPHDFKFFYDVKEIILETKDHKPTTPLSKLFCDYDMSALYSEHKLEETEYCIFKEYQWVEFEVYVNERKKFLESAKFEKTEKEIEVINKRIRWVEKFSPKIGVYAGTFNRFHKGHESILRKAEQIFDKVIVLFAINPEKEFAGEVAKVSNILFNQVDILPEGKWLTDYFKEREDSSADYVLVKGLRNGDDLSYEENQLFFLKNLYPELKVVFLLSDDEHRHISSRAIRNIAKLSKTEAEKYCLQKKN